MSGACDLRRRADQHRRRRHRGRCRGSAAGLDREQGGNSGRCERPVQRDPPAPVERQERLLAAGPARSTAATLTGTWLAGLVGDGGLIRYGRWKTSEARCVSAGARCARPAVCGRLRLPSPPGTFVSPQAEDSGQIAALVGDGRIAVLGPTAPCASCSRPARPLAALSCDAVSGPTFRLPRPAGRPDRVPDQSQDRSTCTPPPARWCTLPGAGGGGERLPASHVDTYFGYAPVRGRQGAAPGQAGHRRGRVLATATGTLGPFQVDARAPVYATRSGTSSTSGLRAARPAEGTGRLGVKVEWRRPSRNTSADEHRRGGLGRGQRRRPS